MAIAKYVTSSNAEMIGAAMQAYFKNMRSAEVNEFLQEVLAKYNYESLEADQWYPSQLALDLYRLITQEGSGMTDLVAIGMQMVEDAPYPADIDSIPKALGLLNEGYKMGIRNYPEDEGYDIELIGDRHVRVHEHCPYPHDIMYGYIYGLSRRFCPPNGQLTVVRTYLNEDDPDSDGAIYDVTW